MRRWIARARRIPPIWLDRALAAAFLVAGVIEFAVLWDHSMVWVIAPVVAYSTLAWRRTRPNVAGLVMIGAWLTLNWGSAGDLEPLQVPLVAVLFMAYAMGAYTTGNAAIAAPLILGIGMLFIVTSFDQQVFTDYVFPTAFVMVAWLAGRGLRTRARLTEELHEAAAQAQEAHEVQIARAAAEERRRIAREMHDVVAHSVSVMVVQAGGARRILERDPRRAVEAAAHIEDVGRAALTEMRRLLGMMHHGEEDAGRAPQPTLRELDGLIERSRAAGLDVTLVVEGEPRPLPAGKDLAAYRVVQEALTNAIKHAGAAQTSVTVRWEPSSLELAIVDRGGMAMNGSNGSGHGLVGMEERMRLYDGSVRAGPVTGGGFEVVAKMPL
ncbi:MAG TPA: histidine kinase [Solirubrobacteraceae bacterium]|nr:histidine kinase [Solirubrobacteraceae bacterium]